MAVCVRPTPRRARRCPERESEGYYISRRGEITVFARTDYRPPYQNCGLTTRKDGYMYRGDSGTESQSACCRRIHVRAMCTTNDHRGGDRGCGREGTGRCYAKGGRVAREARPEWLDPHRSFGSPGFHSQLTRKSGCKMPRLLLVETPLRACLAWADFSVTKVRSSNFSTPAPNDEEKFRPAPRPLPRP